MTSQITTLFAMIPLVVLVIFLSILKARKRAQSSIPTPGAAPEVIITPKTGDAPESGLSEGFEVNGEQVSDVVLTPEAEKLMEERKSLHLIRANDCKRLLKLREYLAHNIKNFTNVSNIKKAINHLVQILATPRPALQVGKLVGGIILAVTGIALIAAGIIPTGAAMALPVAMVLGGGTMIAFAFINRSKATKEWEKMLEDASVQKNQKENELKEATEQSNEYLNNTLTPYINEIAVDLMPVRYASDINAVTAILGLMLDMRAYNTMDAINLYHEISFRNKVLDAADDIVSSARISARAAERSAAANERAADAAAVTAASAAATAASMNRIARASERTASANERIANWN